MGFDNFASFFSLFIQKKRSGSGQQLAGCSESVVTAAGGCGRRNLKKARAQNTGTTGHAKVRTMDTASEWCSVLHVPFSFSCLFLLLKIRQKLMYFVLLYVVPIHFSLPRFFWVSLITTEEGETWGTNRSVTTTGFSIWEGE